MAGFYEGKWSVSSFLFANFLPHRAIVDATNLQLIGNRPTYHCNESGPSGLPLEGPAGRVPQRGVNAAQKLTHLPLRIDPPCRSDCEPPFLPRHGRVQARADLLSLDGESAKALRPDRLAVDPRRRVEEEGVG